jgi:hypothetical protein
MNTQPYNKRVNFARVARPTRKVGAPLLAGYARRWTEVRADAK